MTFICTVYFTVLLWVFILLPFSKLLARVFGSGPF